MSKRAFQRMRRFLKMDVCRKELDAYAWPGGYPIYYVFADGGVCCPKCVNKNIVQIDEETREKQRFPLQNRSGGWALGGMEVNYEEPDMVCDNCGKYIDPAYLDDDELQAIRTTEN